MFHKHTQTAVDPLSKIFERVALPLLLFSAVLFALLFVSWFNILPRFTHFQVSSVSLSPTEMAVYASQMKAQLSTMEETRNHLVIPIIDPSYDALKTQKRTEVSLLEIRAQLLNAAVHLQGASDAVSITHLTLDSEKGIVTFAGNVSHVGQRSMTVLAAYVDAVEALPIVDHLQRPAFTRVQDDATNFHSPFSMQFTLKSSHS